MARKGTEVAVVPKAPVVPVADEDAALIERYNPFFDRLIEGMPIRKALAASGESYTTFMRLKRNSPALEKAYRDAQKDAADLDEEDAVEVIRDARNQTPEEITRANYESRALVWRAGVRNAARVKGTGVDGEGNRVSVQVMIVNGLAIEF